MNEQNNVSSSAPTQSKVDRGDRRFRIEGDPAEAFKVILMDLSEKT